MKSTRWANSNSASFPNLNNLDDHPVSNEKLVMRLNRTEFISAPKKYFKLAQNDSVDEDRMFVENLDNALNKQKIRLLNSQINSTKHKIEKVFTETSNIWKLSKHYHIQLLRF